MDKILLLDAHNLIHRANISFGGKNKIDHVLCQLCQALTGWEENHPQETHCVCGGKFIANVCEKDQPEEVITSFNFFRNLRPLIEMFSPDKCFFALEGRPQFRYDLFADYKANRIIKQASKQETRDTFTKAYDIILHLMQYLPITICRADNYEADDIIGALCENMKEEDLIVISNDSDYIQLLQRGYSNIKIYNPIKKTFMEAPNYPYVAWKSLNGDKSDNIPSLLKPKKAVDTASNPELFKKFLSIEENRANFSINRQLIEFHAIPANEIILQEGQRNFCILHGAFKTLKFDSITNDVAWNKYTKTFSCIKY